jgi:1-acyl-sn-glycerol-3-phosphate acyltransferase
LVNILPVKRKWKIKAFRYVMSKFMRSVLYLNPFVNKTVLNPHNETFDKPSIIIANHTSFLDILAVGMLSPKVIYLVSDWVYNSPVFGIGVKLAGFYPVSQGIEGGVEHLRKKVEEGYSLVVFPEGTRSKDNHIHRFHKGAFYLAQEFGLDIVPILIHGNSEVLPKGDFIIYDGSLTLRILERIAPDNNAFGTTFAEKAKKTGAYFKEQFRQMREEREGPDYFKSKILHSFAYKETDTVNAVKNNLKHDLELYHRLNKHVGAKSSILHLVDNHGETSLLLALQESQRKVFAYIADEEKRDVAKTNYINKKRNIEYPSTMQEIKGISYSVIISETNTEGITGDMLEAAQQIIFIRPLEVKYPDGFETEYEEEGFVIVRKQ